MKGLKLGCLLLIIIIISACGSNEKNSGGQMELVQPIEVEVDSVEKAEVGENITITSVISQGEEVVEDANEVMYEVWKEEDKGSSVMLEPSEIEGHIYRLHHTFDEAGLYHIQVHVTAREMHRMPTIKIQVGEKEEVETKNPHEHEHSHQHHNQVKILIELVEDLRLSVQVEDEPFLANHITLELWKEGQEQHQWIDVKMTEPGIYILKDVETFSGTYNVIVHAQDENVHEHHETIIEF
ncbi:FixH family protein [Halalkalibacter urbisdiaboli]|uniref:FixH family protein n=1 Tax=Halalkalibacter urbisdiaboli TaxID=1960589 RepID=UPI000B4458CA|nr:FixH family protein [Halalkalibacter urbisdiaboli]